MKRIPVFVAAVCLFAISCKKDSNSGNNSSAIVGKWTPVSDIAVISSGGVSVKDTVYFGATSYSDFRSDGKVYSHYVEASSGDASDDTSSYQVSGNMLIAISDSERDTVQIQTLSKNTFVWQSSFADGGSTETHTFTYKK